MITKYSSVTLIAISFVLMNCSATISDLPNHGDLWPESLTVIDKTEDPQNALSEYLIASELYEGEANDVRKFYQGFLQDTIIYDADSVSSLISKNEKALSHIRLATQKPYLTIASDLNQHLDSIPNHDISISLVQFSRLLGMKAYELERMNLIDEALVYHQHKFSLFMHLDQLTNLGVYPKVAEIVLITEELSHLSAYSTSQIKLNDMQQAKLNDILRKYIQFRKSVIPFIESELYWDAYRLTIGTVNEFQKIISLKRIYSAESIMRQASYANWHFENRMLEHYADLTSNVILSFKKNERVEGSHLPRNNSPNLFWNGLLGSLEVLLLPQKIGLKRYGIRMADTIYGALIHPMNYYADYYYSTTVICDLLQFKLEFKDREQSEIIAEFRKRQPIDPFNNYTPLQIRIAPEGVVIYSVGVDRVDDGGRLRMINRTNYDNLDEPGFDIGITL